MSEKQLHHHDRAVGVEFERNNVLKVRRAPLHRQRVRPCEMRNGYSAQHINEAASFHRCVDGFGCWGRVMAFPRTNVVADNKGALKL